MNQHGIGNVEEVAIISQVTPLGSLKRSDEESGLVCEVRVVSHTGLVRLVSDQGRVNGKKIARIDAVTRTRPDWRRLAGRARTAMTNTLEVIS